MRPRIAAALRDERGFTLIEILVVVVIMAILSVLALATYRGYQERAHDAAARENLHRIFPSIQAYFVDHDSYSGMTIPHLKANYDAAIETSMYSMGTAAPTATTFCVQTFSADRIWRKNGPDAAPERQSCP